jgi:hypothetical protein
LFPNLVRFERLTRGVALALAWTLASGAVTPARAVWPTDGKILCNEVGVQSYPVLVADGASGAIVVWEDRRTGSTSDLYAVRVTAGGTIATGWHADGRAVCTATRDQISPMITTDGVGGAFMTWEDYRAGGANTDVYVQHVTSTGAIASGWPADGVAICTLTSVQGHPAIASDGAGGAIVVWEDYRNGSSDIYAQRVSGAGIALWTANGVSVCGFSGDQRFPIPVEDGQNGAIVGWQDERSGSVIYGQRINGAGAKQWSSNGVSVTTSNADQTGLQMVRDGAGGAIASWDDYRFVNTDIFAQRINGLGQRQWASDGVAICTDASEQYTSSLAPDGSGGALFAWNDLRNGSVDIYAQHVTGAGAIAAGWAANGFGACTEAGDQSDPRVASDGAGGAFITWDDGRPDAVLTDIYATRLTGAGGLATGWTANGKVLCAAASYQLGPVIVADGLGGAIVAWYDQRNGSADIYALRVTGTGAVPTVDVAWSGTPAPAAIVAAPNPLRAETRLDFRLDTEAPVTASIVDLMGRRVRRLLSARSLPAGDHQLVWNARDEGGMPVPTGIYLFVLQAGPLVRKEKLAVLR